MAGGRPKAKYSQALRLLQIWEMLHHRSCVTIPQLMEEFGINRRTVQRDLATLSEDYAVEEGERTAGNEKTFRIRPTARSETLRLTLTEMIALYMGKNLFNFTRGTQLAGSMDTLYEKLQARLTDRNAKVRSSLAKKLYCTVGFPKAYAGADDVLNDLLTGLLHEHAVELTYRIPGKRPYDDVVHPLTLVAHNHALYLVCYSGYAKARRIFALERILKSRCRRDVPFTYPADYDPSVELGGAFGIHNGARTEQVRLVFTAQLAPYIEARRWHTTMATKPRRDGTLEVTLDVAVSEELVHWLTGYGAGVKILAPTKLRDQVRERHREAS